MTTSNYSLNTTNIAFNKINSDNLPAPSIRNSSPESNKKYNIDSNLKDDITSIESTYKSFSPHLQNLLADISKYDSFTKQDKNTTDTKDIAIGGLSSIPYVRRFTGIEEAAGSGNYLKAIGKGFIQLINIKGDWTDIVNAIKRVHEDRDVQAPFG